MQIKNNMDLNHLPFIMLATCLLSGFIKVMKNKATTLRSVY